MYSVTATILDIFERNDKHVPVFQMSEYLMLVFGAHDRKLKYLLVSDCGYGKTGSCVCVLGKLKQVFFS